MTIKEAILKSLDDINGVANYSDIYEHIVAHKYYDFKDIKTAMAAISGNLSYFFKNGDTRIKRIKEDGGSFSYYLTKNESNIEIETLVSSLVPEDKNTSKGKTYDERDLHLLLSSFLKNTGIYAKTIFHEQSTKTENNQKWNHPDMVAIKFLKLKSSSSQAFLKAFDRRNTFEISSYEIKKEINTDYELKKSFFQAVSNSSWANYGYLVAFEINESLKEEMERLNQSFGIGIIVLKANPFESKMLFQSKYKKDLDFRTIDKLCKMNKDFEKVIEQTEKWMTAEEKFVKATEKEFDEFCDKYFLLNDSEVEQYCKEKKIPIKKIDNNNE
jgi:hypothetical protein